MRKRIKISHGNESGLTVIELIVSLTILLIFLALSYLTFDIANKMFNKGEELWIAQKEAQRLVDWLDTNLKTSYELLIYNNSGEYDKDTVFDTKDEYFYIFQTEDNEVYYRNSYERNAQLLTEVPVKLEFKIDSQNPDVPKKALTYLVSIIGNDGDSNFSMNSTINFANMLRSAGVNRIQGEIQSGTKNSGNMIKFLNNTSDLSSIELRTGSCFIATASFGSYDGEPVRILRQFRDKFLLTNKPGTAFVNFYYRISPPIAEFIADKPLIKLIVGILLLPLVFLAYILLTPYALAGVIYISASAVVIMRLRKKSNLRKM